MKNEWRLKKRPAIDLETRHPVGVLHGEELQIQSASTRQARGREEGSGRCAWRWRVVVVVYEWQATAIEIMIIGSEGRNFKKLLWEGAIEIRLW